MFDNPEKLFIILLIALFIFGPQKLIGLGGAMGRAIRDFRGAVRDAHEQFGAAVEEAQRTAEYGAASEPPALPGPDTVAPAVPDSLEAVPAAEVPAGDGGVQALESGASPHAPAAEPAPDFEGPDSLASEPSSQAVLESLQEALQRKA
jgi:TatA/E family protein of Tat protein translocase